MTRKPPENTFYSSALIRILAEFSLLKNTAGEPDFAEKLAQWVHFREAIELSAIHSAAAASGAPPVGAKPPGSQLGAFEQGLNALKQAITRSCSLQAGGVRNAFPVPSTQATLDDGGAYPPYRLYHQDQQREIETGVRKLRGLARSLAQRASPQLQTLAALDARFESVLGERETKLLARVPLLLEARFLQLRRSHQDRLTQSACNDAPALWLQAGGWLERYCQELRSVLLAELELRVQPALGLIEALTHETSPQL